MMKTPRSLLKLAAFFVAFGLSFGVQAAFAQESPSPEETLDGGNANGGDNLALAVNTKDDSSVVKFAFEVRRVMNEVVDNTNAAVAVASCENCRTVAVAIQVVLIVNDPEVVSPTNLALALNVECTSCETLASAYQYVFTTDGQVRFSKEGWDALTDIRKAIHDLLKDESLAIETLQAELDAIMDQAYEVVRNELRPAEEVDAEEGAPETTSTPAPEQTDETTESEPTPTPEPEATAEETEPSPTPSS
jgi:putative peptide zinc metalloprotease protein